MAKSIGRTTRRSSNYSEHFLGTRQVLNGQTVVKGEIITEAPRGIYNSKPVKYLTEISRQTPNGPKRVSRIFPKGNLTAEGDITKITTRETAQVGAHRVNTFNQKVYWYYDQGLNINERTIDRVFAGRHHLGSRELDTRILYDTKPTAITKKFFGTDGKVIKTVNYNPETGLRTYAELPDGRRIRYDEKGLPAFTDANSDNFLDLDGLDKLI